MVLLHIGCDARRQVPPRVRSDCLQSPLKLCAHDQGRMKGNGVPCDPFLEETLLMLTVRECGGTSFQGPVSTVT